MDDSLTKAYTKSGIQSWMNNLFWAHKIKNEQWAPHTRMTRLSYGICCWCEQGHFLERLQNKMDWYQRVENLFHEILGGQVGPPPPVQNSGAILVADLISKHQPSAPVEPILVKWDCTSCSNFCKSFAYVWNAGSVIYLLLVRYVNQNSRQHFYRKKCNFPKQTVLTIWSFAVCNNSPGTWSSFAIHNSWLSCSQCTELKCLIQKKWKCKSKCFLCLIITWCNQI
jgi:hypothetical protein